MNQHMRVSKLKITNGERQGEILSSYLFNVHVDERSEFFFKVMLGVI